MHIIFFVTIYTSILIIMRLYISAYKPCDCIHKQMHMNHYKYIHQHINNFVSICSRIQHINYYDYIHQHMNHSSDYIHQHTNHYVTIYTI